MNKMFKLSFLVLLGIYTFSCTPKVGTKITQERPPVKAPEIEVYKSENKDTLATVETKKDLEVAPIPVKPYLAINFQKTACYGKCPVFELKAYSDGRLEYAGKQYVKRLGAFQAYIDKLKVLELQEKALEYDFFQLQEYYPKSGKTVVEVPSTITYVKYNNLEKRVLNKHNAPKKLLQFEKYLDTWLESINWARVQ